MTPVLNPAAPAAPTAPPKARVLFVDDEERIVNLLRLMFRTAYDVVTATSAAQALEIMRTQAVHVIVSDQRMPGLSGTELLARVARESPDTVRLLLTGYADLGAVLGSVNEGEVFRFITKPWQQDEIRATLAQAAEIALLSAAAPAPAAVPDRRAAGAGAGVLVLDDNAAERDQIAEMLGTAFPLHLAANVTQALQILDQQSIGVMVCEAQVGSSDTGDLLHVLKNHFPAIATVMLTHTADSDLVIKLINQARIYRFATKPVRPAVLQLAVSAAQKEHQRCLADSRHAARQRTVRREHLEPSVSRSILQGLKALTERWRVFSSA